MSSCSSIHINKYFLYSMNLRVDAKIFSRETCYHPQTKFAKVMFLQVSVILSTGAGVSRPRPRVEVGGSGLRGVQAHTWEVCPSMH